jgi:hypothetical protein
VGCAQRTFFEVWDFQPEPPPEKTVFLHAERIASRTWWNVCQYASRVWIKSAFSSTDGVSSSPQAFKKPSPEGNCTSNESPRGWQKPQRDVQATEEQFRAAQASQKVMKVLQAESAKDSDRESLEHCQWSHEGRWAA